MCVCVCVCVYVRECVCVCSLGGICLCACVLCARTLCTCTRLPAWRTTGWNGFSPDPHGFLATPLIDSSSSIESTSVGLKRIWRGIRNCLPTHTTLCKTWSWDTTYVRYSMFLFPSVSQAGCQMWGYWAKWMTQRKGRHTHTHTHMYTDEHNVYLSKAYIPEKIVLQ